MRSGLIGIKVGMSSIFDDEGKCLPVTVLKIDESSVLSKKESSVVGYDAVVLGARPVSAKKLTKPMVGYFAKLNTSPMAIVKEFRVSNIDEYEVGQAMNSAHFAEDRYIDVTSITIGKGFAGGMKRHNFAGLEASHGVSISHRSHGSTGGRQDPGKVFKNKKMAGHMGNKKCTVQNLKILSVDKDTNLLFVIGSVPGPSGSDVFISDSIKKSL
jgi:large subunit ribosomal protein L3